MIEIDACIKTSFGCCSLSSEEDYVHIYNLFVNREHRGQGHATFLLKRAISDIRKTGYTGEICIVADPKDCSIDRTRLTGFYERMGLEVYSYYG